MVISDPATSQVLTSGGRYGGLFALLPLFLPFFFFPFGPPQLLLPPAPLALRVPPTAGPPPGRQQPPNSSEAFVAPRRAEWGFCKAGQIKMSSIILFDRMIPYDEVSAPKGVKMVNS